MAIAGGKRPESEAEETDLYTTVDGAFGVPINAVFFRHFSDDSREYLARTWLLDPQQPSGVGGSGRAWRTSSSSASWNASSLRATDGSKR